MTEFKYPWRGSWPRVDDTAFVAPTAALIGDVEIGAESSIWFGCTLRGDVHEIRVGERTNIQDGTVVHVTGGKFGCYIGSDILIGHSALIHGCTLEDGCFIGMRATVLDGALVESGAMVAAGALVGPGKRVPSGELWAGTPAKKMRDLTDADIPMFKEGVEGYCLLGKEYKDMIHYLVSDEIPDDGEEFYEDSE